MRVVLSTIGKFHTFDLARQLHSRGWLTCVYTGYPRFKLQNENLPPQLIHSFPWLQTLFMGRGKLRLNSMWFGRELAWWANQTLDQYVASRLPECDIFMGLSGSALHTGMTAKKQGSLYICDRGSTHIRYQDQILCEEHRLHGLPYRNIDPRMMNKEEAEYEAADAITVGSSFARQSFIAMGVPESKINQIAYGVELSRFQPVGIPDPHRFEVLFVGGASLRKGIPYLLESFAQLEHPRKQLTFVGTIRPEVQPIIDRFAASNPIRCTGPLPQSELKHIMSCSHVMVLPSVEEGLALVQAQALACGCPVIATHNTGAQDIFQDGIEGFIVSIRDSASIAARLQQLADDPALQTRMRAAALQRVQTLGGWDRYGQLMTELFCRLTGTDILK